MGKLAALLNRSGFSRQSLDDKKPPKDLAPGLLIVACEEEANNGQLTYTLLRGLKRR
jgi:hypothetical protein